VSTSGIDEVIADVRTSGEMLGDAANDHEWCAATAGELAEEAAWHGWDRVARGAGRVGELLDQLREPLSALQEWITGVLCSLNAVASQSSARASDPASGLRAKICLQSKRPPRGQQLWPKKLWA
jgi:hypothetical protein